MGLLDKWQELQMFFYCAGAKIMTRNNAEIPEVLKKAIDDTLGNNVPPEKSLENAQQSAQKFLKKKKE